MNSLQSTIMMKIKLAMLNLEVVVVLEECGDSSVVASPNGLSSENIQSQIVSAKAVVILPLLLTVCSPKEYRVDGAEIDENPDVELFLVHVGNNKYDIVRRIHGGVDVVLTDGALSLSKACNVIESCRVIDWQCDVALTRDVETVCVSNAVAIVGELET